METFVNEECGLRKAPRSRRQPRRRAPHRSPARSLARSLLGRRRNREVPNTRSKATTDLHITQFAPILRRRATFPPPPLPLTQTADAHAIYRSPTPSERRAGEQRDAARNKKYYSRRVRPTPRAGGH